jgi:hypothetical protein
MNCVATGRSITFTPDSGGASITLDQWVQIHARDPHSPVRTLAYGELVPSSATLPPCTGVNNRRRRPASTPSSSIGSRACVLARP